MGHNSRSPLREGYSDKNKHERQRDFDNSERHDPRRRYSDSERNPAPRYNRTRRNGKEADCSSRKDLGRHTRDNRDRGRESDRRRDDRERPSTSRRSASPPRRSRSQSGQQPRGSRSQSKSAELEDKAKPNFSNSGLLAAATKTVQHADGTGTVLKYHEPAEARKPLVGWRLYVFKGKEQTDLLHIHRQSAYLIGRDRLVADITIDHPSCSKQHAVIQFRQIHEKNEYGDAKAAIKPFIIDLESTNGTKVNEETVPTSRYFELKLGDVIKFGDSLREYVLLSEDAS
ncbi:SMAD/FHA domain-containing protein [Cytidiella melzeri]|nr:SMAD/FHA domain-containing protein [Cytidiella melzeri]